jgi:hypothetical protein
MWAEVGQPWFRFKKKVGRNKPSLRRKMHFQLIGYRLHGEADTWTCSVRITRSFFKQSTQLYCLTKPVFTAASYKVLHQAKGI